MMLQKKPFPPNNTHSTLCLGVYMHTIVLRARNLGISGAVRRFSQAIMSEVHASEWPLRSFHRRILPEPAVAFSSEAGIKLFREALQQGEMQVYFPLAEQFRTQDEPAFCGLSTLVTVLNALKIDPGRIWKGGWRHFSEDMLDCCEPLEVIKKRGITFDKLACLARCNGVDVHGSHAADVVDIPDDHPAISQFRELVRRLCRQQEQFLVVSYSRQALNQSGDGHFSPVAGYHSDSDRVLILDTARFKLPPHWIPLPELYRAMIRHDPATNKPRGWMTLRKAACESPGSEEREATSVLFVFSLRKGFDTSALRKTRRFFQQQIEPPEICGSCNSCECSDNQDVGYFVDCFARQVPKEFLRAMETCVAEFCTTDEEMEVLKPRFRSLVEELTAGVRELPFYAHVDRVVSHLATEENDSEDASFWRSISARRFGRETLTLLLLASPLERLSAACGSHVSRALRHSESVASPLVQNEVRALRKQLTTVLGNCADDSCVSCSSSKNSKCCT
ncbi:MAG: hypothetical protein MHM6MM_000248 [Cercozoa sp. M6MM]